MNAKQDPHVVIAQAIETIVPAGEGRDELFRAAHRLAEATAARIRAHDQDSAARLAIATASPTWMVDPLSDPTPEELLAERALDAYIRTTEVERERIYHFETLLRAIAGSQGELTFASILYDAGASISAYRALAPRP